MPQGIQIWDAAGNLIMEYTDRVGRVIGSVDITAANQSGSVSNAQFAAGGGWYFLFGSAENHPTVSIAGTTLTWTQFDVSDWLGTMFYGVR